MRLTPTALFLLLGAYILLLGVAFYFVFYADPDESPTAKFLTETLPKRVWGKLQELLPAKCLNFMQFLSAQFLMLFYLAIMFGSWSIILFFIFPWVDRQSYLPHYHKYVAVLFLGACLASWRYAATTSPGTITARTLQRYDHFPYDNLLYASGMRCRTTGLRRLPRSKFDRHKYQANVPRFDHMCGWLGNTIGEENYRFFLLFLLVHVSACGYGTVVLGQLFYGHIVDNQLLHAVFVDRLSGEEFPATTWLLLQYVFDRYTLECAVLLIMAVMVVFLGMFLLYHAWLTSRNVTTNEAYKWDEVRKWYKKELRRYNDAVAAGKVIPTQPSNATTKPSVAPSKHVVIEGDVTCIGMVPDDDTTNGTSIATQKDSPIAEEDRVEHPGPKPKNIYNRGFVENWKEVLFPLSLREKRETIVANAATATDLSEARINDSKPKNI